MPISQSLPAIRSVALIALCLAGATLHAAEGSRAPFNVVFSAIDGMNAWAGGLRVTASFPVFFAPDFVQDQGGKAEKAERAGNPDLTIRPARAAARLL